MGFEAIAYARSAILKDYIKDRYERPSNLQRLMEEPSRNHEDHDPTIGDFGITPIDGSPDTPVQGPYAASQLRNYSLTLLRIILPLIKSDGHAVPDVSTPAGSVKRWVVPESLGKPEFRDAGKSGCGDLWALGAKSRTRWNITIGDGNESLMSKLIPIKDLHGDGVRAIVKDKTTTPLWPRRRQRRRRKSQGFRGSWRLGRGRPKWLASTGGGKEGRLQEKAMAEKEARKMHEEMIRMHRERKGKEPREMEMRKNEQDATKEGGAVVVFRSQCIRIFISGA
ncbi:hypothetical protein HOY80DRAFT_1094251 [Tuber brumale]|nr:hypothetical protein HOY80DRAFT_1094251 [Tuber brumale]